MSALLLMCAFAAVRLVLPIEIPSFTYAVRSWSVLGTAQQFFRTNWSISQLALAVWGIGAVIAVGVDLLLMLWAHRKSRGYAVVEDPLVEEVARRLQVGCPVLVSPDVEAPYVSGIFRPTIYLPVLEMSEHDVELVLAHEAQHIRTHDAQIKVFFGLLSAALWWNPAAYFIRKDVYALLEFRCDAKVTEHMSSEERGEYLEMLVRMARRIVSKRYLLLAPDESPAVGRDTVLGQRIEVSIAQANRKPRPVWKAVQWLVLIAVFVLSYLVMLQPAIAPPAESFTDGPGIYYKEDFVDLEAGEGEFSSFIFKTSDGRYKLYKNYVFIKYLSEEQVTSEEYQYLRIFEEVESE
ncbi:MAG: hypothetical protein HFF26_04145 [Oscillospiraceae bacterium]|nr:hypothetical protein [Oscillospiraceae bacterium]